MMTVVQKVESILLSLQIKLNFQVDGVLHLNLVFFIAYASVSTVHQYF